ncbi:MAG: lipoyl(octanoyl) transferase LipB [Bacteroidales bacterium]
MLGKTRSIQFRDLGLIDYKEAWDLQEDSLALVVKEKLNAGKTEGNRFSSGNQVVYFCEHPHVYTLGKSGQNQNLLIPDAFLEKINATFYRIDRGGDITYHGPGQIVGYPIIDLEALNIKVKEYVWGLEETVIRTLADYGIESGRLDGTTGVWLDKSVPGKTRKICAIGVRVSRYVTMHGFALNVNTDLRYFQYINPCGFTDKGVTSMQQESGREFEIIDVRDRLKEKFSEVFQVELHTA